MDGACGGTLLSVSVCVAVRVTVLSGSPSLALFLENTKACMVGRREECTAVVVVGGRSVVGGELMALSVCCEDVFRLLSSSSV